MMPSKKNVGGSGTDLVSEPMAFISYTTFDNLRDRQAIVNFCEQLSNEVGMRMGKPFQIFCDKKDIRWGEHWRVRIEEGLDACTFLIPILTPAYFQSQACQEEYNHFIKREKHLNRNDLILPVYYVECDVLENRELCNANPWAEDISSRQYEDWRHLRWEPSESPAVGRALEHMAKQIKQAINAVYRRDFGKIKAQFKDVTSSATTGEAIHLETVSEAPVVRAMDLLIHEGVKNHASDILIEPERDNLRIRYRIDGVLHNAISLPLSAHPPLISRLKIMANMNIADHKPQDGYFTVQFEKRSVNIRVVTFNTVHGTMGALHISEQTLALRSLPELGFSPENLEKYSHILENPFGMILVTGPTGSGKTTTLYTSINHRNSPEQSIMTIEEHIECTLDNVSQMQVNIADGGTLATGLRTAMKFDPDIIFLSNIPDKDTAQLAIQCALTGHLVLSSIQASDTTSAIYRLIDLGAEPFPIISAITGVVAQRLVRIVCPHCSRYTTTTTEEEIAYENETNEKRTEFLYGAGCNFCAATGYLGRTAIFEVMTLSDSIREALIKGAIADDIRNQAVREGMIPLRRDGMLKVKKGITTPYEVIRNSSPSAIG